ncbi:hypothetical protein BsWGS_02884 [Bradybaena similaris]
MSPATKIQRDTLNFGWFSLPTAKKDHDSCQERLKSPAAGGELQEGGTSRENDKRATPREGSRADGQPRPDSQPRHDSQPRPNSQPRPDSQPRSPSMPEPANRSEVELPQYELQQQGYSQKSQNYPPVSPAHNENVVLDWPVSTLAGQLFTRHHVAAEPNVHPRTPLARSESQVPPVPIPPLHWQGYQNGSRPTYATWQSQPHGNRNQQAENTFDHVWNTSNNNNNNNNTGKDDNRKPGVSKNSWKKEANKIWDKSPNNNSNTEQQRGARNQCSSNKPLMSVSNYSIDGNNNNWLQGDTEGGASPTKSLRTLPPYEYSTELSSTFYSPSVVMNWEDTEQQSNSAQDKQGFKHASLMKRIRSSLLHLWSLVPCLKNQDEDTTPRSRLFKYDRFDNEKSHG